MINSINPRSSVVKQLTEEGLFPGSRISPSRSHSPISEMGKSRSPGRGRAANPSLDDLEDSSCNLNPKVEGRVLEMTPEVSLQIIDKVGPVKSTDMVGDIITYRRSNEDTSLFLFKSN